MSKANKKAKARRREIEEARKLTGGKLLRLTLKSALFAMVVAAIIVGLGLLGLPYGNSLWFQFGVMLVVYLIASPFLMSEFRPKTKGKE